MNDQGGNDVNDELGPKPEATHRAARALAGRGRTPMADEEKYGAIPDEPTVPDLNPEANPAVEDAAPDEIKEPDEKSQEPDSGHLRRGRADPTSPPEAASPPRRQSPSRLVRAASVLVPHAGSGGGYRPGMSDTTPSDLDPTADNAESNPNAGGPEGLAGGMGVSSERVGPTGPGQVGTDGERDTSPVPPDFAGSDGDVPPEQQPGQVEANPSRHPAQADPRGWRRLVQGEAERRRAGGDGDRAPLDQPSG